MFVSGKAICVFGFIGFALVLCDAQEIQDQNLLYGKLDTELIEKKNTLQCYDCNSEYDPRCADPFDSYSIGVINCTDRKTPEHLLDPLNPTIKVEPTVCRKIVQIVEQRIRVIRSCGYIKDDHDDLNCYRRTGTSNVEVRHCSCTQSLCNKGLSTIHSLQSLTLPLAIIILSSRLLSF